MSEDPTAPPAPEDGPCEDCVTVSGRAIAAAVLFAAFAAYVAADFATGGKLTAFLLAILPRRSPTSWHGGHPDDR